jgi:hypothetical protein
VPGGRCAPPAASRAGHPRRRQHPTDGDIHPLRLCEEVKNFVQREAILSVDGQEILNFGRQSIPTYTPGHRLDSGPFGTMGVGLPFAVGAKARQARCAGHLPAWRRLLRAKRDGARHCGAPQIAVALHHQPQRRLDRRPGPRQARPRSRLHPLRQDGRGVGLLRGPALALAAHCHQGLEVNGWAEDPEAARRTSVDLARRALRSGPEDPNVLSLAAFVLGYFGEDINVSLGLIDRCLTLNPSCACGWHWSALLRVFAGQPDTALQHFETYLRLSPRDRMATYLNGIGEA